MGQEVECRMHWRKRALSGKAYLETDFVLFRGEERLKVAFKDLTGVHAADGILKLDFAGGPAELELGKAAAKWADKILNPPSRADKLGLKPGLRVRLAGSFEADFEKELPEVAGPRERADLVFFAASRREQLGKVAKLLNGIKPGGALWIVYPKGVTEIREVEVIGAGRAAGWKDVKVARFSESHTALKFVG